jgi:hypothetical protein
MRVGSNENEGRWGSGTTRCRLGGAQADEGGTASRERQIGRVTHRSLDMTLPIRQPFVGVRDEYVHRALDNDGRPSPSQIVPMP